MLLGFKLGYVVGSRDDTLRGNELGLSFIVVAIGIDVSVLLVVVISLLVLIYDVHVVFAYFDTIGDRLISVGVALSVED
jgi:hypothetical protein